MYNDLEQILFSKEQIAKRVKDKNNKSILLRISTEEQAHAHIWQQYTKKELKPSFFKVLFFQFVSFLLGYTFVIKILETHEAELIGMLNEERLNYIPLSLSFLSDSKQSQKCKLKKISGQKTA